MPILMCPNCQTGMKEITREQILIDICPDCQGVWLDRGELQKLLEFNKQEQQLYAAAPAYQEPARPYREPQRQEYQKDRYRDGDDHHQQHKGQYRKKSKLESLFEMFD